MSGPLVEEVKNLHDAYIAWLKDQAILKQVGDDWVEISTPLLDRHNDFLSIYVCHDKSGWKLTDDGYTINDLRMSGCAIEKGQRAQFLSQTLMGFGIQREGDALTARASSEDFSLKKHSLLQAMLAVGNLFFTSSGHVGRLFWEDVRDWFDNNNVRYNAEIKVTGKTGYDRMFDFLISKSRKYPERFIQTINAPEKRSISQVLFNWLDIAEIRQDARFYIILNDQDQNVSEGVLAAIRGYSLPSILWSNIENFKEELVA